MNQTVAAGAVIGGKKAMIISEHLVRPLFSVELRFHDVDSARPPLNQNVLVVDFEGEWYEGRSDMGPTGIRWVYADGTPFADGLIKAWTYMPGKNELNKLLKGGNGWQKQKRMREKRRRPTLSTSWPMERESPVVPRLPA